MTILNENQRASVRTSEAGETGVTTHSPRGGFSTIFYTRSEAEALIGALRLSLDKPMETFVVEWSRVDDE